MERLVVVADNPLIAGAIRTGLRGCSRFHVLGYVDPRRTSVERIIQTRADVVLVDEAQDYEPSIALIRSLREQGGEITVIVLTLRMDGEWPERAFAAGAHTALSKAMQPAALATLISETVAGHIVHPPPHLPVLTRTPPPALPDHCALTERETEILRFVVSGATNAEIARELWITQQTVKFHVSNVYRKLDVCNRTEACHYAHVHGLVPPEPDSSRRSGASGPPALAIAS